jgi:L-serine dehydratase
MTVSVLDLFSIGIGPSSSHTVGPMRAAKYFVDELLASGQLNTVDSVASVKVSLFGSLALTGKGHGTDSAVILGLGGAQPESVDPDALVQTVAQCRQEQEIILGGKQPIAFCESDHLEFLKRDTLPGHSNAMRFVARDTTGNELLGRVYYSVGGGFVTDQDMKRIDTNAATKVDPPFPYKTGDDLLHMAAESGLSISDMTLANEKAWRSESEIFNQLEEIWLAMQACVSRGCRQAGVLPGGLKVQRRAAGLFKQLTDRDQSKTPPEDPPKDSPADPLEALDWVDLFALAVSEENAAGSRVVTAPTNGAAGIIPAVMHYHQKFCAKEEANKDMAHFLLTAGAIGILYKENASLSGAEVGCQGEVGVACSMAAAGLTEVLGGSVAQVEQAAEIGMEHNLGLTCDPVGGLVQVPCIERNAMGAVKAINAARLALRGDGTHRVSLDKVIATMRQTGADMMTKYKETSRGGLALNVVEC